jgi:hypothetical protein
VVEWLTVHVPRIRKAIVAAVAAYGATLAGGYVPTESGPAWGIYVLAGAVAALAGTWTYFTPNRDA